MIFRGRVAEVPSISTQEFLLGGSEEYRERPALIDGPSGRTITYGDLAEAVRATSAGLVARGFRQGDVLALMSPNAPEYAIAILGVLSAGGIVTTLNPLYTVGEIVHQLADSGAKYLFTTPSFVSFTEEERLIGEAAKNQAAMNPRNTVFDVK